MLSYTIINSQCQVSDPGPKDPLVDFVHKMDVYTKAYGMCCLTQSHTSR